LLDPQGLRHRGREHGRAIPLGDIRGERMTAIRGDLVAFLAIFRRTARIGHERALLSSRGVAVHAGHPGIDVDRKQARCGLVDVLSPRGLSG